MNRNTDISEQDQSRSKDEGKNNQKNKSNGLKTEPLITGGGDPNLSPDAGKRLI